MPRPTLRLAEEGDEAFLLALFRTGPIAALCETALPPGPQREALILMQYRAQSFHYTQAYGAQCSFLVVVEGVAAGRLFLHEGSRDLRVVDMVLLPEWRGRGIGTRLIRDLQARAAASGRGLSLAVEHNNPCARRLYERMGFHSLGDPDPMRQEMVWSAEALPPAAGEDRALPGQPAGIPFS